MNIIKLLLKEKEAGRTLISANGDIISPAKLDKNLIKVYSQRVSAGELADTTYSTFKESFIESNFYTVDEILTIFDNSETTDNKATVDEATDVDTTDDPISTSDELNDPLDGKFVTY